MIHEHTHGFLPFIPKPDSQATMLPPLVFQLQNSPSEIQAAKKTPLSYLLPLWRSAALSHPAFEYPAPLS